MNNQQINVEGPENDFDRIVAEKKQNKKRNIIVALVSALIVIVLGTYFCFTKIFVIKEIKVVISGEEINFSDEQVIDASGLEYGTKIGDVNEDEVRNNAKFILPFVGVDVETEWPSTVILKVSKKLDRYYVSVRGKLYVLAENLTVLRQTDDIQQIEKNNLICLKLPEVKECIEGEEISIPDDIKNGIKELSSLLEKHGLLAYIDEIDYSNKFDIKLNYDARFSVIFGDIKDAEKKIQVMKIAIEDKTKEGKSGVIDLTDANTGVYRPY